MKILHGVEMYAPVAGGAQEVVRQISTRLASRGHDVTVATRTTREPRLPVMDGVSIREFDVRGNAARGMTGQVAEYRDFVTRGGFDVVMLYAAQQWAMDALLPVLDTIPAAVVIAPCGFSGLADPRYSAYFDALPGQIRQADRVICHSTTYQDALWLDDHHLGFEVVPNGAAREEFADPPVSGLRAELGIAMDAPVALLVGGHTGLKGHDEAMRVFLTSQKMAGGVLLLNGNHPARVGCGVSCAVRTRTRNALHRDRKIMLTDFSRSDLIRAYFESDVLLSTSSVECSPLVLFEAAAAGLPFVASDAGNSSEIAEWTGCGFTIPWPRAAQRGTEFPVQAFSDAVDALLADRPRRREMSEAGRRSWRDSYTWDRITDSYESVYAAAMADHARRAA
jgi:L-malate glycosyltransferase